MPNHWHFVLWPRDNKEVSEWVKWMTHTHTQRWHAHYHTSGTGHLYQGRFKSFAVQNDAHLLLVLRYVERNALRAGLVEWAEAWRWGSLWQRERGLGGELLSNWPVERPDDWVDFVNEPQSDSELETIRTSVKRGRPFGGDEWVERVVKEYGLESTMRAVGRLGRAELMVVMKMIPDPFFFPFFFPELMVVMKMIPDPFFFLIFLP